MSFQSYPENFIKSTYNLLNNGWISPWMVSMAIRIATWSPQNLINGSFTIVELS